MAGKVPRYFGFTEEYLRSISPASVRAIGRDRGYGEAPFGSTGTVVPWFLEKQRADTIVTHLTSEPGKDFQNSPAKPVVVIEESGKASDGGMDIEDEVEDK